MTPWNFSVAAESKPTCIHDRLFFFSRFSTIGNSSPQFLFCLRLIFKLFFFFSCIAFLSVVLSAAAFFLCCIVQSTFPTLPFMIFFHSFPCNQWTIIIPIFAFIQLVSLWFCVGLKWSVRKAFHWLQNSYYITDQTSNEEMHEISHKTLQEITQYRVV